MATLWHPRKCQMQSSTQYDHKHHSSKALALSVDPMESSGTVHTLIMLKTNTAAQGSNETAEILPVRPPTMQQELCGHTQRSLCKSCGHLWHLHRDCIAFFEMSLRL